MTTKATPPLPDFRATFIDRLREDMERNAAEYGIERVRPQNAGYYGVRVILWEDIPEFAVERADRAIRFARECGAESVIMTDPLRKALRACGYAATYKGLARVAEQATPGARASGRPLRDAYAADLLREIESWGPGHCVLAFHPGMTPAQDARQRAVDVLDHAQKSGGTGILLGNHLRKALRACGYATTYKGLARALAAEEETGS